MDLKENFAKNLCEYRKLFKLTQAELAEKLNYSDKAVSKWERAESLPDVITLKRIADFFGIKIDTLLSNHSDFRKKIIPVIKNLAKQRIIKSLMFIVAVWFLALCTYVTINLCTEFNRSWMIFIYALPLSFLTSTIFSPVREKTLFMFINFSLLLWTALLAVYLSLFLFNAMHKRIWEIFLLGIPVELLLFFRFLYKKVK